MARCALQRRLAAAGVATVAAVLVAAVFCAVVTPTTNAVAAAEPAASNTTAAPAQSPADLPTGTHPGDLIFRRGSDASSALVLAIDGGDFSHVGMLLGQPGAWQVVHATPAERADRADGVVIDDLAFFLHPSRSQAHAVFQVQGATSAQRAQAQQHALAARGRPFRLADPAGSYCTVLVWHAWQHAGLDLAVAYTWLDLPLVPGDYLLPGPLSRSPRLLRVR